MNHVERFRSVMNFEPVDRLPLWEWATCWDKTIDRWRGEGLPADLCDPVEISQYFGLDPYKQCCFSAVDYAAAGELRVDEGVSTMDDYLHIRPFLHPAQNAEIERMRPWADRQKAGEAVLWITLEGFFWFPRRLFGIENHLYAFFDHPELMHKINSDLLEFNLRILDGLSKDCVPTFMTIAEDMSYNHGPMISQATFEEFIRPYYLKLTARAKELGIICIVDTDGDVTQMVPWMQAVGVDGVLPLERQAGVDGLALREQFPELVMIGHYDKMVMNKGEGAIRAEFERLLPIMKTGGFVPSVDHQTPPGVSLEEYRVYLSLMKEYCSLAGVLTDVN